RRDLGCGTEYEQWKNGSLCLAEHCRSQSLSGESPVTVPSTKRKTRIDRAFGGGQLHYFSQHLERLHRAIYFGGGLDVLYRSVHIPRGVDENLADADQPAGDYPSGQITLGCVY